MDRELKIPVLQVVGFKNSGKTSLIESLIVASQKTGYRAGIIKHHGHGGGLELHDRKKDTGRFRDSGAVVTGITAENELEMRLAGDSPLEIEQIVEFYQQLPLDFILIEGFKQASFPKVIMAGEKEDYETLRRLQNVVAVITSDREWAAICEVPVFHISEEERYLSYLLSRLEVEPGA
ncbi:MAG TPA: molybdopterin-guanine dinucleotide biosynthesis protein B [Bacillales bacterium]|nr:molybdopterin-guanine dinucleotide biosynthesis protein B [Bacillales bacterium]